MNSHLIGSISEFFAANRALSWLVLMAILCFGTLAFVIVPKQYNPEIIRPAFVLSTTYQGATQAEVIERILPILVSTIQVIPGVDDILTEVHDDGSFAAMVMFEVGVDPTLARTTMLTELERNRLFADARLPFPLVQEINPETIPVMQIALNPTDDVRGAREQALQLRSTLLSIQGVSEVRVYGGDGRVVMVAMDPTKLTQTGLSPGVITRTIAAYETRQIQTGFISSTFSIPAVLEMRPKSVAAIAQLPLTTDWLIQDVAEVYEGRLPNRGVVLKRTKDDGSFHEVVMVSVSKQAGTSAPVVTEAVRSVLAETLPSSTYTIVSDDGVVAKAEIDGLTINLLQSIAIVAVVLLLFLSTRAAAVVLVTIPLTFLVVLGLGYVVGESINRITLFALILSLGLLVDSAIVVVENIYAHLKVRYPHTHYERIRVIGDAVREVGAGLVLSTVTSVLVFVPLNFITGMMGPYMGPLSFFVPAALIVSLVIAIMVTPFVASVFVTADEVPNLLGRYMQRMLATLTERYTQLLTTLLVSSKLRRIVLWGAGLMFVGALVLPAAAFVHFQMLPTADRDQLYVYIDAPVGTSVAMTERLTTEVVDIMSSHPQVLSAYAFVATTPIIDFNGLFKGAQYRHASHQATIRVNLISTANRSESSTDITMALRAQLKDGLQGRASYVRLTEEPPGPPVQATLVAKVSAGTDEERAAAADALAVVVDDVMGVTDVYNSREAAIERLVYTPRVQMLQASGVSPAMMNEWLEPLTEEVVIGEWSAAPASERVPIVLTTRPEYREVPALLSGVSLPTSAGEVALSSLLETSYDLRPSRMQYEGVVPVTYVTGEVEARSIVYVVLELINRLRAGEMTDYTVKGWDLWSLDLVGPSGQDVSIVWGGEWEMTLENFRDLGLAMMIALFLVYAVLVAQYGSFATPGYILVTVPLGLIGILIGFFFLDTFFGIYLTATALIGFIALIGIVVNNAIIYLEYVAVAKHAGANHQEALISAGAARLRPILLTSLTTVLGSLTIAADPVWSGLAWSIVFGLSLSTVLTLIILPTLLANHQSTTSN